jgi:DNA-binding SARP family transcriptional activator
VKDRSEEADRLEVRLLGGFQVQRGARPVAGFESQKVRALFSYLVSKPHRPLSRDHLATVLWPDEEGAVARRNLRQALYNLRRAVSGGGRIEAETFAVSQQEVILDPEAELWVDAQAFDEAAARGLADGLGSTAALSRAAQLYRGDFLAGFYLKDGGQFEDWLLGEQERLRETAIEVLRALADRLGARGEYELAVQHARRLTEMDPLSEEAHRQLMRFYTHTGRRNRALMQYETLADLLDRELGVEPVAETRAVYEAILGDALPEHRTRKEVGPLGPFVPLVGRAEAFARLGESFEQTVERGARLMVVDGESGIGKTRMVRSFLNQVTARRGARVLQGRSWPATPPRTFAPFAEMLQALVPDPLDTGAEGDPTEVRRLGLRLAATLGVDGLEPPPPDPGGGDPAVDACDQASRLLAALTEPPAGGSPPRPLVLFLDDLHTASTSAAEVVERLLVEQAERPLWIVAAVEGDVRSAGHPLHRLIRDPALGGRIDRLTLGRLGRGEIEEIAHAVVGDLDSVQLTDFLERHSVGLPLAVVELVNLLCDEGTLRANDDRVWELTGDPPLDRVEVPQGLDAVLRHRVSRLPTSTRRLLTVAALIGHKFDVGLLQHAADEHLGVVEIGIELLLERWLIRQFPRTWTVDPRERDLVLWARGVRRGSFEFAHHRIRQAVYHGLNPLRRQYPHRKVGAALADRTERGAPTSPEALAHHWVEGGDPLRALPLLRQAAERALALGDRGTAHLHLQRATAALARLGDDQGDPEDRAALEALGERLEQPAATT